MHKLTAKFRIVTPMFLAGATPNQAAELRVPSIKGALRFWYRAIDPDYRRREPALFGGAGDKQGQAEFLLTASGPKPQSHEWSTDKQFLKYFSFPLKMGANNRRYIKPGKNQIFTLYFRFKTCPDERQRKSVLASLWLLGHLGGLGARSRRGFGTIALKSWECSGADPWEEFSDLQIAHGKRTIQEWMDTFTEGLDTLKQWFPGSRAQDHLVFSSNTAFHIAEKSSKGWEEALSIAAENMCSFRRRRAPDYENVKAHICYYDARAATVNTSLAHPVVPSPLSVSPARAAFGLPLTVRYSSLKYEVALHNGNTKTITPGTTFEGSHKQKTRSASRVMVRVIEIDGNYHPLFCRFDGPILGTGHRIKDKHGTYRIPGDTILDDYWNQLPSGSDVSW